MGLKWEWLSFNQLLNTILFLKQEVEQLFTKNCFLLSNFIIEGIVTNNATNFKKEKTISTH